MNKQISFQVSPKGGISVYGLQRFPITLYVEQWAALFGCTELAQFVADNAGACQEQQKLYKAALAVGESRGLSGESLDKFVEETLVKLKPKDKPTVVRRPQGVDQKLFDMIAAQTA